MTKDKIYILVPTRDRPDILWRMIDSWLRKRDMGKTELIVIIDKDQKELYHRLFEDIYLGLNVVVLNKRYKLVPKLNLVANGVMNGDFGINPMSIGFVADDCVFQSSMWEIMVANKLEENKGMVYCNDLLQGERLPNNIFIHTDIIKKLGSICPCPLNHYFVDNYWRELGVVTNKLYYFSNLYIEHMHWSNNKSEKDALYKECEGLQTEDRKIFDKYRLEGGVRRDANKILNINGNS